jgi:DNA-binding NarL/FixJ family response regulator
MTVTEERQALNRLYRRRAILDRLIAVLQQYASSEDEGARGAGAIEALPGPESREIERPAVLRVLLVSEEPVLAEGLRSLLSSACLELVAVCAGVREAMEQIEATQPDMALLHVGPACGLDQALFLRGQCPRCAMVLWVERMSMEEAGRAMGGGVRGILSTTSSPEELLKCLRAISQGVMQVNLPTRVCSQVHWDVRLSRGQSRLVSLIGQGLKNKEIATALGSTEGTVKTALNRVFKLLRVKDRFELAICALEAQATWGTLPAKPRCELIEMPAATSGLGAGTGVMSAGRGE